MSPSFQFKESKLKKVEVRKESSETQKPISMKLDLSKVKTPQLQKPLDIYQAKSVSIEEEIVKSGSVAQLPKYVQNEVLSIV